MLQAMRLPGPSSSIHSVHGVRLMATTTRMPKSKDHTATGLPPLPPLNLKKNPDGALRPQLTVNVDPNHGLWAFFRKIVDKDGNANYETLESRSTGSITSSRSWTAAELRRKSFKDLHTLWYIVLRERNLLATQLHQLQTTHSPIALTYIKERMHFCRKTMARIKYIVNERRLAYEGAITILEGQKEAELDSKKEKLAELEREKHVEESGKRKIDEMVTGGIFGPALSGLSDEPSEPSPVAEDLTRPEEPVKKEEKPMAKSEDDIYII